MSEATVAILMLTGTVHACGPDPLGHSWEWDHEHKRPVAMVESAVAERLISGDPHIYGLRPSPRKGGRPRKEASRA